MRGSSQNPFNTDVKLPKLPASDFPQIVSTVIQYNMYNNSKVKNSLTNDGEMNTICIVRMVGELVNTFTNDKFARSSS